MTEPIYTKRGDSETPLSVNMNVTGASLRTLTRPQYTAEAFAEHTTTAVDAAAGALVADTSELEAGAYDIEVEVTQDGKVATFPDRGYGLLVVYADLG